MKVLFVCVHNSARSQMAEAFVNDLSGGGKRGTGTWSLNPVVVDVMSEINIDIV